MIIDFHTHLFPPELRAQRSRLVEREPGFAQLYREPKARMATAEELLASMDRAGVQCSVILNFGWSDPGLCAATNDYLLEAARSSGGRLIPFCMVQPNSGARAVAELERCVQAGARGVGELRPEEQGFDLEEQGSFAALAEAASALGVLLLLHSSEPVGHAYPGKGSMTPDRLYRLVQSFPQARFVLAHWGGGLPFYALMPEVAAALQQVYVDTAATPLLYRWEIVEVMARIGGPERILFGSDFPLLAQGRSLAGIRGQRLSEEGQRAILGGNAAQLLGLEAMEGEAGGRG